MSVVSLIASDNYIPVNKVLIKKLGLAEAVILGELCTQYSYWLNEDKLVDGMFYCSSKKLEERTGLSEYQQRKAIKSLEQNGVLITDLKGLPATKYFFIDENKLSKILQTSSEETKELVPKKLHSSNNINNNNKNNSTSISKDIDEREIKWFLDNYHKICVSLPKVMKVTDRRKKAILKILKVYSKEDILRCFELAEESDFLKGNNDRGWKADIDFILRNDKFVSILESKYGGKKRTKSVGRDIEHMENVVRTTDEEKEYFRKEIRNGNGTKF